VDSAPTRKRGTQKRKATRNLSNLVGRNQKYQTKSHQKLSDKKFVPKNRVVRDALNLKSGNHQNNNVGN
jgi:hypothetical protein